MNLSPENFDPLLHSVLDVLEISLQEHHIYPDTPSWKLLAIAKTSIQ